MSPIPLGSVSFVDNSYEQSGKHFILFLSKYSMLIIKVQVLFSKKANPKVAFTRLPGLTVYKMD